MADIVKDHTHLYAANGRYDEALARDHEHVYIVNLETGGLPDKVMSITDLTNLTDATPGAVVGVLETGTEWTWNGTVWVDTNVPISSGSSSAIDTSYNNTESGSSSSNVQDALDELFDEVKLGTTNEVYSGQDKQVTLQSSDSTRVSYEELSVLVNANDYYFGFESPNKPIIKTSMMNQVMYTSGSIEFDVPIPNGAFASIMVDLVNVENNMSHGSVSLFLQGDGVRKEFPLLGGGNIFAMSQNTKVEAKITIQPIDSVASAAIKDFKFSLSIGGIMGESKTNFTGLYEQDLESISGTPTNQNEVNKENAQEHKELPMIYDTIASVDEKLSNLTLDNITDINVASDTSSLIIYDSNAKGITTGWSLVEENEGDFNRVDITKSAVQNMTPSANAQTITWNAQTATGTMFTRSGNKLVVNQAVTNALINIKLNYDVVNVNSTFRATVKWEVLLNDTVVPSYSKTVEYDSSQTSLFISIGDVYANLAAGSTISVRATVTSNNPSATIKILHTSEFSAYKPGSTINKVPFKAIEKEVIVNDSSFTVSSITSTPTVLATHTIANKVYVGSGRFNARLDVNRTGSSGSKGQVQVSYLVNGTTTDIVSYPIRADDESFIQLTNINSKTFNAGDVVEIKAAYFGSGNLERTSFKYEFNGNKV